MICNKERQEDKSLVLFLSQSLLLCLGDENTYLKWSCRLNADTTWCSMSAQARQEVRWGSQYSLQQLTIDIKVRSYPSLKNDANQTVYQRRVQFVPFLRDIGHSQQESDLGAFRSGVSGCWLSWILEESTLMSFLTAASREAQSIRQGQAPTWISSTAHNWADFLCRQNKR